MRASIVLGADFARVRVRARACILGVEGHRAARSAVYYIDGRERVAFEKRSRAFVDHPGVSPERKGNSLVSLPGRPVIIESSLTRAIIPSRSVRARSQLISSSVRLFVSPCSSLLSRSLPSVYRFRVPSPFLVVFLITSRCSIFGN